jgi:hypothetical protein
MYKNSANSKSKVSNRKRKKRNKILDWKTMKSVKYLKKETERFFDNWGFHPNDLILDCIFFMNNKKRKSFKGPKFFTMVQSNFDMLKGLDSLNEVQEEKLYIYEAVLDKKKK